MNLGVSWAEFDLLYREFNSLKHRTIPMGLKFRKKILCKNIPGIIESEIFSFFYFLIILLISISFCIFNKLLVDYIAKIINTLIKMQQKTNSLMKQKV